MAGPAQPFASTSARPPATAGSACRWEPSRASPSSPRPAAARRARRPTSPAGTPASRRSSGRWRSFCRDELLPFLFADAEDDRQQYTMVIHNVTARLREATAAGDGAVSIEGEVVRSFRDLVELVQARLIDEDGRPDPHWAGPAIGAGTVNAFIRRLYGAVPHVQHLLRADVAEPERHRVVLERQVTVVDLHNLNDRAKRFVVGVVLRKAFEDKERAGQARPLQFVVLDELNKYAPRDGSSPIKEILLDVAERGRSLGMILIGAQQTASEVERRIVANSAIRVVGRLDAAEAARGEYGFLPGGATRSGQDPQAGDDAGRPARAAGAPRGRVPLPGVGHPGQRGGRGDGRRARGRRRAAARSVRGAAVRFLHTGDWHVGKTLRGRSRADEHRAVLAEIAAVAEAEQVDAVLVAGDLFDTAAPTAETEQIVYRRAPRPRPHRGPRRGRVRQPRQRAPAAGGGPAAGAGPGHRGGIVPAARRRRGGRGRLPRWPRAGPGGPAPVPVAAVGGAGRRADGHRGRPAGAGLRRADAPTHPGASPPASAPTVSTSSSPTCSPSAG